MFLQFCGACSDINHTQSRHDKESMAVNMCGDEVLAGEAAPENPGKHHASTQLVDATLEDTIVEISSVETKGETTLEVLESHWIVNSVRGLRAKHKIAHGVFFRKSMDLGDRFVEADGRHRLACNGSMVIGREECAKDGSRWLVTHDNLFLPIIANGTQVIWLEIDVALGFPEITWKVDTSALYPKAVQKPASSFNRKDIPEQPNGVTFCMSMLMADAVKGHMESHGSQFNGGCVFDREGRPWIAVAKDQGFGRQMSMAGLFLPVVVQDQQVIFGAG